MLAARPGLGSGDAAVGEITRLRYLPLAIGMLARQLCNHPARTAVGLAADLTVPPARPRHPVVTSETRGKPTGGYPYVLRGQGEHAPNR